MKYRVGTFREAGLEARWTKRGSGQPVIVARDPKGMDKHQRETWYVVDRDMFENMRKHGIRVGFDNCTALADIFSIPMR